MRAVEHAELHQLEGGDVLDELDADGAEAACLVDEAVLDDPLAERLVHDRREVEDAGERGEARDVLGLGRGDDAVDHGGGEGALGRDPVGEAGVVAAGEVEGDGPRTMRPFSGRLSQQSTVKGGRAAARRRASAATRKPGAERGASGWARSWDDVGVVGVEPAGGGLVAIALLGDGEADTMRTAGSAMAARTAPGPRGRRARSG